MVCYFGIHAPPADDLSLPEWILGYRDTTFPFNERQCERIMEIYQVLRSTLWQINEQV
jgi:hypothetical protein